MKSSAPKVLQPICGREMVGLVADALRDAGFEDVVVVVPPDSSQIADGLGPDCCLVEQAEPLGTGHALAQARDLLGDHTGNILVINGRRAPDNLRHPVGSGAPSRVRPKLSHSSDVQRASLGGHGPRGARRGWRSAVHCREGGPEGWRRDDL